MRIRSRFQSNSECTNVLCALYYYLLRKRGLKTIFLSEGADLCDMKYCCPWNNRFYAVHKSKPLPLSPPSHHLIHSCIQDTVLDTRMCLYLHKSENGQAETKLLLRWSVTWYYYHANSFGRWNICRTATCFRIDISVSSFEKFPLLFDIRWLVMNLQSEKIADTYTVTEVNMNFPFAITIGNMQLRLVYRQLSEKNKYFIKTFAFIPMKMCIF